MKLMKLKLLVIALVMFAATSAFASFSYDFTYNTHYLIGQTGNLSFQFTPIGTDALNATATISAFTTDGTLAPFWGSQTNASGNINGSSAVITNVGNFNEYFHGITFGDTLGFHIVLANDINNGAMNGYNTFSLNLYDIIGTTPLPGLYGNTDGTVFAANIYSNGTGADVTPTPIPAAAWLLGSGLMGLAGLRRRKK
jgi:hypothetical protein